MKTDNKKGIKVNKRRFVFALTACIIIGIFIYNIPSIYDFFMYSDFENVEALVGGDYRLERYDGGILAYNNNEMTLVDTKGEKVWSVSVVTASPKVCIGDDYILLADLNGRYAYLYDGEKLRTTVETKDEIFDAAVDERGNIALATREQGHKGTVTVYDKNGNKKYVFGSGSGHIGSIDIHKDNIVISQIEVGEKQMTSRIALVNWEDNRQTVCGAINDEMVFCVKFQSNGDIIALSDKGFCGYNDDGEVRFNVSYNGRKLMKYNTDSDDNLVFCFYGDRNNTVIESYSKSGKLRGSRSENDEISNLDVCGEAILISSMRSVKRVYPDGDAGEAVISRHDVRGIKLFDNRRHGFLTGNSNATVIKIKK